MDEPGKRCNVIGSNSEAFGYLRILVPERIPMAVGAIVQKVRAYTAGCKLCSEMWLNLTGQQGVAWSR